MTDRKDVAIVVAHPDDETLWAGGTIMGHRTWQCLAIAACRKGDPDRAPRYAQAVHELGGSAVMADLDDGPEQTPLPPEVVEDALLSLLSEASFDVALTHGPWGEYTRHRRHEEVSRAVTRLWVDGRLSVGKLWLFAYSDEGGRHLPRARADAHRREKLPGSLWRRKKSILTDIYGFGPGSFEVRAAPRTEGFWCFEDPDGYAKWLRDHEVNA